jgi:tRNA(Ile)-lysidine synthase
MDILRKVTAFSRRHDLLAPGDAVLVAVSGGPDSLALLHLLYELREQHGLRLEVAHLQHGMRGQEAVSDARFVQDCAERLALPFHLREVSIPSLRAQAGRGNLEELARCERYRFFAAVAEQRNLDKVATAHTEDDQAETVLMWLFRGAGRKGLGGMAPRQTVNAGGAKSSKAVTIIRPLLGIAKEDLLEFLERKGLEYRLDRSNEDGAYLRNWLRRRLLPQLKQRIDERLPRRLAQLAELLRDEADYFDELAQAELDRLAGKGGLSGELILRLPKAMQRQLLRRWIRNIRGHLRGIDFDHIEALVGLISGGVPHSRLSIPGGWEAIREYDLVRLSAAPRNSKPLCYAYPLVPDAPLRVREAGMTIHCQRVSGLPDRLPDNDREALFDLAALTEPLLVRNFRPGDRFQPLGMAGHKKVKDLFIEKKAPLSERAVLPLLVMGQEVLWLPGYARSEIGRIARDTKNLLRLSVVIGGLEL